MLLFRPKIHIETERLVLRLPRLADYGQWSQTRRAGADFLLPWEPVRDRDYSGKKAFRNRVYWSAKTTQDGRALPLFLTRRTDGAFLGAITLSNIRRGPAQMATLGYWIGPDHARQGLMSEAVSGLVAYAFDEMDLSRIEAACLKENAPSRGLLERCGFKYEGVAQSYLQIAGRWRNHVLYANIRDDRRGRSNAH